MVLFYTGLEIDDLEDKLMAGKLGEILEEDDSEKFKKYLEDEMEMEMVKDTITNITCCTILDLCLMKSAKKCSFVMLNHPSIRECGLLCQFGPTLVVYIATYWEDLDFLQLMFDHCDADFLPNQIYEDILPIHEILLDIMNKDPMTQWGKGDSLIKLIILLISAREARPRLDCARLVADNTSKLKEVALGLFHGGDVKELAALLLLSYDRLFHSFKSGLSTVVSHDALPTISSADMVSHAIHGDISDVYALVYLFHKAGRDLSNFYTSMTGDEKPADVITKVARLIKNAGFPITYRDVDLAHVYSFKHGVTNSICKAVGVKTKNGIKLGYKKPRFASVYCLPRHPCDMEDKYSGHRRHDHLYLQPIRQYCTAPQNHTIRASKLALSSPSLRSVAFLAMRLTRGIRML